MKRLLAALLVLTIVPLANATMLDFDGAAGMMWNGSQWEVNEGAIFTVQIVGDTAAQDFKVGAIAITGDFSGVALGTVSPGFDTLPLAGQLKDGSFNDIWIIGVSGNTGLTTSPVAAGEVLYSFSMKAGSAGNTITIDDWAGVLPPPTSSKINNTVVDMAGMSISIVPEPATLLLLGLGCLFLRKRRR